ncbi:MAG: PHP domain-containing protein [Tissierellaceae bacterium]
MIKLIGDYHTHTIYSSGYRKTGRHATGTIRENAEVALSKGLREIAITEHGPSHYLYGLRKSNISKMRDEINRLNEEFMPKGLKILLGLEANLIGLDGSLDLDETIIKYMDIILMGYHYGAIPKSPIDGMGLYFMSPLSKFFRLGSEKSKELITRAYIRAMAKYHIDLISHPGSKARVNIVELAEEARKRDVALEISAKHSELSVESLRQIIDIDVKLMVNSDAHRPQDVGEVHRAIDKARSANLALERITNIEIN